MSMNNEAFNHRSCSVNSEVKKSNVPGLPSRHASYSSAGGYRPSAHRSSSSSNSQCNQNQQGPELLIEIDSSDCNSRELQHQTSQGNSRFPLPSASLMKSLESSTSSSILHGIVLICIMISSLISFVLSLISEVCDDHFNVNCSTNSLLAYSLTSMLSCLFCFIIYFLHLIGQCDYVSWSAKRKIIAEIIGTFFMLLSIIISVTSLLVNTSAIDLKSSLYLNIFKNFNSKNYHSSKNNLHSSLHSYSGSIQAAFISSLITILCYILRILSLARESRMLASKPSTRTSNITSPDTSFKVVNRVNGLTNRVTNSIRSFTSSVKSSHETSSL